MPETAKVNGPEVASSKTEEPGIGAKKIADRLAEELLKSDRDLLGRVAGPVA